MLIPSIIIVIIAIILTPHTAVATVAIIIFIISTPLKNVTKDGYIR